MNLRVLIAGCGYVGTALGRRLAAEGHQVFGLRRDPQGLPDSIEPLEADLTDPGTLAALPGGLDAVVYAASSGGGGDGAYRRAYEEGPRNLLGALEGRGAPVRRLLYVSSTGVYGQDEGEWVDEGSPTDPVRARARSLLAGERIARESPHPATVVRFGGIYGPGRTRLVERVRAGDARCPPRTVYSNRIHRDDCAGVLRHLLLLADPDPLYVAVDREPAPLCEVLRWLARRLGAPDPPVGEGGRGSRTNKRCSSRRLVGSGYDFGYPTFREGYDALLRMDPRSTSVPDPGVGR